MSLKLRRKVKYLRIGRVKVRVDFGDFDEYEFYLALAALSGGRC